MLQPSKSVCVYVTFLFLLLAIIPTNAANHGAFQGFFNFRQVSVLDSQVSITLDVKILNHTGADVHGATISVQSSYQPKTSYGSFPAISIASGHTTDLSQALNLPQMEFQRWQSGAKPRFLISYTDESGNTVQQSIELTRRPLKGGN